MSAQEKAAQEAKREAELTVRGVIADTPAFRSSLLLRDGPLAPFVRWLDSEEGPAQSWDHFSVCVRRAPGTRALGITLTAASPTAAFVYVSSVSPAVGFTEPSAHPLAGHPLHTPLRVAQPPPAAPPPSNAWAAFPRGKPAARVAAVPLAAAAPPPPPIPTLQVGDHIVGVQGVPLRDLDLPLLRDGKVVSSLAFAVALEACKAEVDRDYVLLRVRRPRGAAAAGGGWTSGGGAPANLPPGFFSSTSAAASAGAATAAGSYAPASHPAAAAAPPQLPVRPMWSFCAPKAAVRREIVRMLRQERTALRYWPEHAKQWVPGRLCVRLTAALALHEGPAVQAAVAAACDAALASARSRASAFPPVAVAAPAAGESVVAMLQREATAFELGVSTRPSRAGGVAGEEAVRTHACASCTLYGC